MLCVLVYFWGARLVGKAIESFIETLDHCLLGVQINIESMSVSLMHGRLEIDGVKVDNPPEYKSEYLMKAERLVFDIDVWSLLSSWGKLVIIQDLELRDIGVNMELEGVSFEDMLLAGAGGFTLLTNNILDVLHHMDEVAEEDKAVGAVDAVAPEDATVSKDLEMAEIATAVGGSAVTSREPLKGKGPVPKDLTRVRLERVHMENIAGTLSLNSSVGLHLAMPNITLEDFSAQYGDLDPMDVVRVCLRALLDATKRNLLTDFFRKHFHKPSYRQCCWER